MPPSPAHPDILIIDDSLAFVELLAELFAHHNLTAHPIVTWELARQALNSHSPRLILLDMALPDADPLDVLRFLRADPRTTHLPIVAVASDAPQAADARAAGATETLLRTQAPAHSLLRAIQRHLDRQTRSK